MIKNVVRSMTVPALLALVLIGCSASPAEPSTSSPPTTSDAAQAQGFPVTVENCGRTLTFDKPPERVVTGYHPVFETMVDLDLGDRIIGRTNFSENGPDGFLPGHKKVYDTVPEISDNIELPQKEVDVTKRVKGLEPVAVLATDGGSGPVNAFGGSGLLHQMIEIAGGRNVLADLDEDYAEVSVATQAAARPRHRLRPQDLCRRPGTRRHD